MEATIRTSPSTDTDGHRVPNRPSRAGRALLSAGLGLLALAQPSSAGAAESEPGLRWKPSGGVEDGGFSGTVALKADVSTENPVDGWSISVLTRAEEPVFGVICRDDFRRPRNTFDVNCRWDTSRYPDQRPSANAHYLIRLMTRQGDTVQPAGPDRAVTVNNQASAPTDVTLSSDRESGKATLTWAANPEPDVAHYDVEEKTRKGNWTRIAETTDTHLPVTVTEPADHRFRVAAERRNSEGAANGPGLWTQASPTRAPTPEGAKRERPADRPAQPGANRRSGPNRRSDSEPPSDRDRDPGPKTSPDAAAGPENPSPSPTSKPGSADGTRRKATSEQAAGETKPPAETRSGTPTPAAEPAPADRAALAFSPSSADAFATLRAAPAPQNILAGPRTTLPAAGKRPVAPKPALRPAASPAPDPGFAETLPYPLPREPESVAAAPEEPPAPSVAMTTPPPTRRSSARRRLGGIGLFAAGVGLFGTTLRPARRGRHRRRAAQTAPSQAALAVPSSEEPAWLARLEDCVTRLEACLTEEGRGANRCGTSADLT